MKRFIKYIIVFVVLYLFEGIGFAMPQDVVSGRDSIVNNDTQVNYQLRTPAEDFLDKYRQDPAFNYSVKADMEWGWWKQFKWWLSRHIFKVSSLGNLDWMDTLLKVLAALIVIFAIYKLVRSKDLFPRRISPEELEGINALVGEPLNDASYQQLVEEAVRKNDFVLAIRIHYWFILHLMNEKEMIRWEVHKTNRSYGYELKDEALKNEFNVLTRIFDCVCYGEFEVSATLYQQLEPEFKEFRSKIER